MAYMIFMRSRSVEASSIGYREQMTGVWLHLIAEAQWTLWQAFTGAYYLTWAGPRCALTLCLTFYITQILFQCILKLCVTYLYSSRASRLGGSGFKKEINTNLDLLVYPLWIVFDEMNESAAASSNEIQAFPLRGGSVMDSISHGQRGTGSLLQRPLPRARQRGLRSCRCWTQ